MTKVKCDNPSCRYSEGGYCKRFEITVGIAQLGEIKSWVCKSMQPQ